MSPTIGNLALALSKAQAKIEGAKKDAKNPFFKSQYADLASVWDACHQHLSENELALIQTTKDVGGRIVLITLLAHKSGEWIRSELFMPTTKPNDPQAVGSAMTYARRYALMAMVGVCPIDDDAELASGRVEAQKAVPAPTASSSNKKNQIVKLMNDCGLQPTTPTPEAWAHAVKSALNLELVEANYDAIISMLEKQLKPDAQNT